MVDLDIAEVIVGLGLASWQHGVAQGDVGRFGAELEAVAVEVVTVGGDELQLDGAGVAVHQAQAKGFAHR